MFSEQRGMLGRGKCWRRGDYFEWNNLKFRQFIVLNMQVPFSHVPKIQSWLLISQQTQIAKFMG